MGSALPYFKTFAGEEIHPASALSACSLAAQGLHRRLKALMWLSPRRGYLLHATGRLPTNEELARMCGVAFAEFAPLLEELTASAVISKAADGGMFDPGLVAQERELADVRKRKQIQREREKAPQAPANDTGSAFNVERHGDRHASSHAKRHAKRHGASHETRHGDVTRKISDSDIKSPPEAPQGAKRDGAGAQPVAPGAEQFAWRWEEQVVPRLEEALSGEEFGAYIRPLRCRGWNDDTLWLAATSEFLRRSVVNSFMMAIQEAVLAVGGVDPDIRVEVVPEAEECEVAP